MILTSWQPPGTLKKKGWTALQARQGGSVRGWHLLDACVPCVPCVRGFVDAVGVPFGRCALVVFESTDRNRLPRRWCPRLRDDAVCIALVQPVRERRSVRVFERVEVRRLQCCTAVVTLLLWRAPSEERL